MVMVCEFDMKPNMVNMVMNVMMVWEFDMNMVSAHYQT
jgi:hypothetical protein